MVRKGQAEVGFVLRVAIGMALLVSMLYAGYTYLSNAEKSKMNAILASLGRSLVNDLVTDIADLPDNSTLVKRYYLPSIGDPFSLGYFIILKNESYGYLELLSGKGNSGVVLPLFLNLTRFSLSGNAVPPLVYLRVERSGDIFNISVSNVVQSG